MSFFVCSDQQHVVPCGKTETNASRARASRVRGGRSLAAAGAGASAAYAARREEDVRHQEHAAQDWTEVVSEEESKRGAYLEKCQKDCLAAFPGLPDRATLQTETTVAVPSKTILQMTREIARMRFQLKQASRIAREYSRQFPELQYLARQLSKYKKL